MESKYICAANWETFLFLKLKPVKNIQKKLLTISTIINITILTNRAGDKDQGFHFMQTQNQVEVYFFYREGSM